MKAFRSLLSTLIIALVASSATPGVAQEVKPAAVPEYRLVPDWPKPPATLRLGAISGVAIDSQDRVFVLQRAEPPVLVFNRAGEFVMSWGQGMLKTPHGLRIDRDDSVWVTDMARHVVVKYSSAGKPLLILGQFDVAGDRPDRFNKPTDTAIGAEGEIYVSDGYGNARVAKFSKEGKFLMEWGHKGTGPGELNLPHSIRLDPRGRVFVGDRENDRVQIFEPDGKFVDQWRESGAPYGLFLDQDRLFVADGRAKRINVLDASGKRVGGWSTGEGVVNEPHWVCVDRRGDVYVTYVGGKRLEKYAAK